MKNMILGMVTGIFAFIGCIGICCMDSEKILVPAIMVIVSLAWGAIFTYANAKK